MKLPLFLLPFVGSVLAMSIPREEAEVTPCTCEPISCIQSWPDSCYCANTAKKACYDKCGGEVPVYDTCPPRDVTVRAEPEPEPELTTPPPTCECEQTFCIDSWPESCHCRNNAKKACFDKCGGEAPTYQTCPPLTPSPPPPAAPVVVARAEPAAKCKCTEINCTKMWPTGCYCLNYAKQLCYEECGGERPALDICHEPSPPPASSQGNNHVNLLCDSNSASACPPGQMCVKNPFKPESCGPACGEAGICVEKRTCGGFMGRECEKKGQICMDHPTDDCDPKAGGSDCAGVCVWPQ